MAHNDKRVYSNCIFCRCKLIRKKTLSTEHVFGDAVRARYPVVYQMHAGGERKKSGGQVLTTQSRSVCRHCNENELGKTIEDVLEPLFRLINSECERLSVSDSKALRRYWERVALILDVETSNLDLENLKPNAPEINEDAQHRQWPPIISQEEREQWRKGKALHRVRVHVGRHHGCLGINPALNFVVNPVVGTLPEGIGRSAHQKLILVVIGAHAVALDIGTPMRRPPSKQFVTLQARRTLRIEALADLGYDDYLSMMHQDGQVVAARIRLADPSYAPLLTLNARLIRDFRFLLPEDCLGFETKCRCGSGLTYRECHALVECPCGSGWIWVDCHGQPADFGEQA